MVSYNEPDSAAPFTHTIVIFWCWRVQDKIEAIACGTYGAAGVSYSPEAEEAIQVGVVAPPQHPHTLSKKEEKAAECSCTLWLPLSTADAVC